MLSIARRVAVAARPSVRAFSGGVAGIEQLTGVNRRQEIVEAAFGVTYFDRDAIAAVGDQGTAENPIPVLSSEDSRIVGITFEDDNEIRWFTLKAGEKAYDPVSNNYFALKQVTEEEITKFVQGAEAAVGK